MTVAHPWLPRSLCGPGCLPADDAPAARLRALVRIATVLLMVPAIPLLALPLPGQFRAQRGYCRLMLRCLGVRISTSGGPIRNLRGVLVVSGHISWLDVFAIGAVLPGSFVARADVVDWPAVGLLARVMKVIPIDRANLRRLPAVVQVVTARLRAGHTVVAFPEGTTSCGLDLGPFRPAMFQAAIDAGRPVQPLQLTYHHRDGRRSAVPAFVGDESLGRSFYRLVAARLTVAHVHVAALQLPGESRRDLARRCEREVSGAAVSSPGHALAA